MAIREHYESQTCLRRAIIGDAGAEVEADDVFFEGLGLGDEEDDIFKICVPLSLVFSSTYSVSDSVTTDQFLSARGSTRVQPIDLICTGHRRGTGIRRLTLTCFCFGQEMRLNHYKFARP